VSTCLTSSAERCSLAVETTSYTTRRGRVARIPAALSSESTEEVEESCGRNNWKHLVVLYWTVSIIDFRPDAVKNPSFSDWIDAPKHPKAPRRGPSMRSSVFGTRRSAAVPSRDVCLWRRLLDWSPLHVSGLRLEGNHEGTRRAGNLSGNREHMTAVRICSGVASGFIPRTTYGSGLADAVGPVRWL
jgi:hypothetical protein